MSHNITGKCKGVQVQDLEDELVKEIVAEKFKWRVLGPGAWTAYGSQGTINADMLVAVPQEQGSVFAQQLTEEQKKKLGLTGNYSVIAIQKGKPEKAKATKPGEVPKEEEGSINVTMDDSGRTGREANVDVFMRNVSQAVNGAKCIRKANRIMQVLGKAIAAGKAPAGAKIIGPGAIKSQVMSVIGTKGAGKVTING